MAYGCGLSRLYRRAHTDRLYVVRLRHGSLVTPVSFYTNKLNARLWQLRYSTFMKVSEGIQEVLWSPSKNPNSTRKLADISGECSLQPYQDGSTGHCQRAVGQRANPIRQGQSAKPRCNAWDMSVLDSFGSGHVCEHTYQPTEQGSSVWKDLASGSHVTMCYVDIHYPDYSIQVSNTVVSFSSLTWLLSSNLLLITHDTLITAPSGPPFTIHDIHYSNPYNTALALHYTIRVVLSVCTTGHASKKKSGDFELEALAAVPST
jgi:hypothetical protein